MRAMTFTRRAALTGLLGGAALGFTACTSSGYPADPDGTLDRVTGGVLRAGPGFRRRSCCLIYRVFGRPQGLCGDCVLRR